MTTDRNTIAAAFAHFFAHIKQLIGTTGDDSLTPIRSVLDGEVGEGSALPPTIVVTLLSTQVTNRTDSDKVWLVTIGIKIKCEFTSASEAATTREILSKVSLVEDKIESYARPEGVEGFENAIWSYAYPLEPMSLGRAQAASSRTFTVAVSRGQN